MTEWQRLMPFPRDKKATGLMCWPASDDGPEEIRFGRILDHWATFDRPTYWIPCAAPGSPPSLIMRVRYWFSGILYRIWPRDDMTTAFWSYHQDMVWCWLTRPFRKPEIIPPFVHNPDDDLPF
jgi:hypothetical protein